MGGITIREEFKLSRVIENKATRGRRDENVLCNLHSIQAGEKKYVLYINLKGGEIEKKKREKEKH